MGLKEDREKLKESYKEHYKAIREAKEKLRRTTPVLKISEAISSMQNTDLVDSMDEMVQKLRIKAYEAEAKIEQALDQQFEKEVDAEIQAIENRTKAQQTVDQIRAQMGDVYDQNEAIAKDLRKQKTIGKKKEQHDEI
jgi:hypothetical protein